MPPAVAFATGIALEGFLPLALWWAAWIAAVVVGTAALVRGWPVAALAAIALATLALGALRASPDPLPDDHVGRLALPTIADVEGRVTEEPVSLTGDRRRLLVDVERVDGAERSGRLQLMVYGAAEEVAEGQRIAARARLRRPSGFRNPGGFDYAAFLARDGVHVVASATGRDVRPLDGARAWNASVRRSVVGAMVDALPPASAALLAGLLLGARTDLPAGIQDGFRRAGVYHVLAVSGFNVALVASAVFTVALLGGASRRVAAIVAIVGILGFAAVVGPEPSVLRAVVMGVLVLAALLLDREASVLNSLGLAAIVVLALRPRDLLDPGFQLSFAATAGIVLAPMPRSPVLAALAVSLGAEVAILPITTAQFNQVSLIGPLANLGVVPLAAVATIVGLAGAAIVPLSQTVASWLFNAMWPVLLVMRAIVHLSASVPGAFLRLPAPHWTAIVVYVGAVVAGFAGWHARARSRRHALGLGLGAIALLAVAITIGAWPIVKPGSGRLRVTVLDVGQADAIVVETPDRRSMIIDAGPGGPGRFDVGERVVAPFLLNTGVRSIDAIVTTHAHADHAGGIPALRRMFTVRESLDATTPGQRMLGPVTVSLLPVASPHPHRQPDQVFVRLEYGLASFVFASDADADDEHSMLAEHPDLRATVLKVAHHGSPHGSSAEMLSAVRPSVAIVSVGGRNPHGHPGPETLRRFEALGASVYRTDRDGAIVVETDGRVLTVTRWADRRSERFCLDPESLGHC